MACMCGDICCSSCGPAQGNSRCPVCRAWASEGCDDPAGCAAKLPAAMEAERLAAEAEAESYRWEAEHADEIARAVSTP